MVARVPEVEVRAVSAVDDVLRGELLACWTDVTNAGGAVGFVPPVTADDVAPVLDQLLEGVHSGRDVLAVLTVDGATAGLRRARRARPARCAGTGRRSCGCRSTPRGRGTGLGRALMAGVHDIARERGWEFLHLTARGGTGVDAFYRGLGYREVGRMPGAIRVAPGDDRDEILLVCPL